MTSARSSYSKWLGVVRRPGLTSRAVPSAPAVRSAYVRRIFDDGRGDERTSHLQYSLLEGMHRSRPVHHNSNAANEFVALQCRVLTAPHRYVADCGFAEFYLRFLKSLSAKQTIRPVPFAEYIQRSGASRSVKRRLIATKERLRSEGINHDSNLEGLASKWATRKAFVKVENLCLNFEGHVTDKAPRLIQGAAPEFICLVGPWIMALQDHIGGLELERTHRVCFAPARTNVAVGEFFESEVQRRILENDFSAYDGSIDESLLKSEVEWFKYMGAPRAVLQLTAANCITRGVTSNGWKYGRRGMRKSGDPYTTLCNSLLNAAAHKFLAPESSVIVAGDDCVCFYDKEPVGGWDFSALGFKVTAIKRDDPREAEFCSSMWSTDAKSFVPKVGRTLAKLGYMVSPPLSIPPDQIMRGVAMSTSYLHSTRIFKSVANLIFNRFGTGKIHFEATRPWLAECRDLRCADIDIKHRYGLGDVEYQRLCDQIELGQESALQYVINIDLA